MSEYMWLAEKCQKLETEKDRLESENARLREGIAAIKKHMKVVLPTGYKLSLVYCIAESALEGEK